MIKTYYSEEPLELETFIVDNTINVFIRKNIESKKDFEDKTIYLADEYSAKICNGTIIDEILIQKIIDADYDKTAKEVRAIRNRLLAESDAYMISDRPSDKEKWTIYRQALRDITRQQGFPYDVVFPVKPKE